MDFSTGSSTVQRLYLQTNPDDNFDDETEAIDDDMYPDELDESSNSLEDDQYPDDDEYESDDDYDVALEDEDEDDL